MSTQRPGESDEEYRKRNVREAPPLSDEAKIEIRAAADEYWAAVEQLWYEEREARRAKRKNEP